MRAWWLLVGCIACSAPERATVPAGAKLVAPGLRLPDDAAPISYELRLELDPERETFGGKVEIQARLAKATDHIWLHADQLTIDSATWNGGALAIDPVQGDQMRAFRFGRVVEPGVVTLSVSFTGSLAHDQEGLFRQRAEGGGWFIFSQGESVFARRFTPCFDEPRFKTPWHVTVVVPKDDVALGNMPEERMNVLADGRKEVTFAPTPPLPSYLVALAVGPFDLVDVGTVGQRKVPARVAVRHGAARHVGVVAAKLPAVVAAVEAYTGTPLPFPKLDLVGVPKLFGAMENPGLITFDEPILVGAPKEESFASYFVLVAAHELAHQWFGDSVTPVWWDDLWLSEGFASWLGNKVENQLGAVEDPPLRYALTRREAIAADTGSDAAPLRRVMQHNNDPDDSFDEIAYQKGQVVLTTFESWLGADRFRDILRAFLAAHAGGNAMTADLVADIKKATDDATAAAFDQYVRASGVPVVDLALSCTGTPVVTAHARDGRAVPVCVRYGASKDTCALVGDHTELAVGATCPAWVIGNPRAGYYHVAWTTNGPRGPAPKLGQLDPVTRITSGDDIAAQIARGELPAKDAIGELRTMIDANDAYATLGAIAIAREIDRLVDDAARPAWSAWLGTHLVVKQSGKTEADLEATNAIAALVPAERFPLLLQRAALTTLDKILAAAPHEVPDDLITLAAPLGGDKLFTRILQRARAASADERGQWFEALGHFGTAQAPRVAELLVDKTVDIKHAWGAMQSLFDRAAIRSAAWTALRPKLADAIHRMTPAQARDLVDAAGTLCDNTSHDEVKTAFMPLVAAIEDGRARLDRAVASIDRCILTRSKLGDVAATLSP